MGRQTDTGQTRSGGSTAKKPKPKRKTKRRVKRIPVDHSDDDSADSIRHRRPPGSASISSRPKKPPDRGGDWQRGDSDADTVVDEEEHTDTEKYADDDDDLYDERDKRRGEYQTEREKRESSWRKIWTVNGFIDPWLSGILGKTFGWWVFRRFIKETPWMIMLAQVVLMAWIGTTCLEPVDSVLGGVRYYATIGDYSLGGWGYCVSGTCTYEVGYSLDLTLTMDVPLFSNAIVLPYLCMTLVLGSGILLFFFFYLLIERWRDYRWTQQNQRDLERAEGKRGTMPKPCRPFLLAKAGFVATQFELRSQNSQRLERDSQLQRPWWRPWQIMMSLTMWIAFAWNLVVFVALETWMRLTLATAEQGDDLKYWAMAVSTSWVIISHVYRSYWVYGSRQKEEREEGEEESDWSSDDGLY